MLFHFPKTKIEEDSNNIFNNIQDGLFKYIITYMINSKYRTSVSLKGWIKQQVDNPDDIVRSIATVIDSDNNPDVQVMHVLKWIRDNIRYVGDLTSYLMDEYWATGRETLNSGSGDCEDGAILIYLLCRLKGIPANRLIIFAGDVNGGGHCWIGYKPTEYPLNFAFLDWCYWYNTNSMVDRNKFYINNKEVIEYEPNGKPISSNYFNIWFGFNEEWSSDRIR